MNNSQFNPSYKVIADHLRCSAFLIADGVLPDNEGRGYVLRRIMRRAMLHMHKLNNNGKALIYKLVPSLIEQMGKAYPELVRAQDLITETLKIEEERFLATVDRGLAILEAELAELKKGRQFSGKTAFKLYDTYGFPLDLTENLLREKDITVNLQEFDEQMALQKQRAKESWSGSGGVKESEIYFDLKEKLGKTEFLGYSTTKAHAEIMAILKDGKHIEKVEKDSEIILNQTPFYATSGGQRGDDGNIILESEFNDNQLVNYQKLKNVLDIGEVKKYADGLFVHPVTDVRGNFKKGDKIVALVNNRNRQFRAQNHSATHLLHFALKKVLGNQITQKGSDVRSTHFTFDFNYPKAVEKRDLDLIEDLVNFYIRQNSQVQTEELPIKEAQEKGAVALFGEKYDDIVRVLSMAKGEKDKDLSVEFCGGTHVKATGNIGLFKIISEKGIAAGIRRIEAKTGYFALQHLQLQEQKLYAVLDALKVKQQFDEIKIKSSEFYHAGTGFDDLSYFSNETSDSYITGEDENNQINQAITKAYQLGSDKLNEIKQKDKEIEKLKKEKLSGGGNNFTSEKIGNINFLHHLFEDMDAKEVRNLITDFKNKSEYKNNSVILFFGAFENKISVAISISDDLTEKLNAASIINDLALKIGGKGGGGKANFAMGGGNDKNGIKQAVAILRNHLQ